MRVFNVGDKARVRKDLVAGKRYDVCVLGWCYCTDTITTSRFQSYDDGSYTVDGKENIEKWINWSYEPEKAIYAEYSMERMRAFKRC